MKRSEHPLYKEFEKTEKAVLKSIARKHGWRQSNYIEWKIDACGGMFSRLFQMAHGRLLYTFISSCFFTKKRTLSLTCASEPSER